MKSIAAILLLGMSAGAQITNNVMDWGATGDGVTFDTAAFISACTNLHANGGGVLYIPNGTYMQDRSVGVSGAINLTSLSNITFLGESRTGAVIKLSTDGTYGASSDAHVIRLVRCQEFTFRNLTIDGSKSSYGYHDEQMHELYLLNSTNVTCDSVTFTQARGDGIFLIGDDSLGCPTPPCRMVGVLVTNCWFTDNGRSGIANQGGLVGITYENNLFERTSDQDIDFEPTGTRPGPLNVVVRGNRLLHTNDTFALTLGGTETSPSTNYLVENNTILGKTMLFRTVGMRFVNNYVILDDSYTNRALTIQNASDDMVVANNYIKSNGDFVVYGIINTVAGLTIASNVIRQTGVGRGIRLESLNDRIHIHNNRVYGLPTASEGISVAIMSDDGLTRTNYSIAFNGVVGFGLAIRVSTATNSVVFSDYTVWENWWVTPQSIRPVVLFKLANDDDVPAGDIITQPTVMHNLWVSQ